jgi:hypothetical protein
MRTVTPRVSVPGASVDVRSLDDIAHEANREHQLCDTAYATAVEHAVRAGALLIEAKERMPHGTWGTWLVANFAGSRHASRRAAREAKG